MKLINVLIAFFISTVTAQAHGTFSTLQVRDSLTLPGGGTIAAVTGYTLASSTWKFLSPVYVTNELAFVGGGYIQDTTGSPEWTMTGGLTLQTSTVTFSPLSGGAVTISNAATNGALTLASTGTGFAELSAPGTGNVILSSAGGSVLLNAAGSATNLGIVLGSTNAFETLGDTFYVGGTNPNESTYRLPGNTAAVRKYYSQTGTGSVSAAPAWVNAPFYNVQDYGIMPDSTNDWSSALNALISTAPNGSAFYFPQSGSANYYRIDGLAAISNDIAFFGDANCSTYIKTQSTTAPILQTSGNISITNLQFGTVNTRTLGHPLFALTGNAHAYIISNVQVRCTGDMWNFNFSGGTLHVSNCEFKTLSPASGYVVTTGYGQFDNCLFNCTGQQEPAFIQIGNSSGGLDVSNCKIAGGGPQYSYGTAVISSITSNGTNITVTNVANCVGINPGTWVVLNGMTTTAYNGFFRVFSTATLGSNTTLVLSPIGPPFCVIPGTGTCTIGTGVVETVPCACLILGGLSAAIFTGDIFEANSYPTDPFSAGVFIDGTQNNNGTSGITFNGCVYDDGIASALLHGGGTAGSTQTISDIQFQGGFMRSVFINKVQRVKVRGVDNGGNTLAGTSAFGYIYSDANITSDFCEFHNTSTACNVVFLGSNGLPVYGLIVDGGSSSTALNNLGFSGNTMWGTTGTVDNINGGVTSGTVVYGAGNGYFTGASAPPTHVAAPTYFP